MKMVRRVGKFLGILLGGAFGLVLVGYILLLWFNRADVPPSPTALRFAAAYRDRVPVADGENGYLYLLGFSANPDRDPAALGAARLAWERGWLDRPGQIPLAEIPGAEFKTERVRPAVAKRLGDGCTEGGGRCLALLEGGGAELSEWLASEQWLLARYKSLISHPAWFEPLPPDVRFPLPRFGDLADGQRLLMAEAWGLAGQGDAAGVGSLLARDIGFWRIVLAQSDTLISKMVAAAALKRHFDLGNLVLRRLPEGQASAGVPAAWSVPIEPGERSMRRVFVGEWMLGERMLREVKSRSPEELPIDFLAGQEESWVVVLYYRSWPLLAPLLQVQDGANREAALLAAAADSFDSGYDALAQAIERARTLEQELATPQWRLFNPLADPLFFAGMAGFIDYGARIADLEGTRRSALLASQLRARGGGGLGGFNAARRIRPAQPLRRLPPEMGREGGGGGILRPLRAALGTPGGSLLRLFPKIRIPVGAPS